MTDFYLDKNVLSHIISCRRGSPETNGVTNDDVNAILKAVAAGKVRVLLSLMNLQEASYALRAKSKTVANEELQLIKDLIDSKYLINFPMDLLINDVVSYASGGGPVSPFIPNTLDLEQEFSSAGNIKERKKTLDETDKHNAQLLDTLAAAKDNDKELVLRQFEGKKPTFESFYAKRIEQQIVETIQRVEKETKDNGLLDACKKRGIAGLLKFKTIALADGANLSYQYGRVFDELSEKQRKRLGDPNDLLHALSASAADVLVTHDRDFAFWIGRIPNKGIEVVDHLHKLVERL